MTNVTYLSWLPFNVLYSVYSRRFHRLSGAEMLTACDKGCINFDFEYGWFVSFDM